MGIVQVGYSRKGLAKLNDHKRDKCRRQVRDGVTGEGQDLSEEDEARINDGRENVNSGEDPQKDGYLPKQVNLQQQQLQPSQDLPSGPEVRWDCYLPFGSLKILLVEHDDSTRQILTALLRNCNYEVTPAVNGLQAWKILVDLSNRIDLVLTEVAVPGLPGFGLLCKIMSHKTCKNIPVIMMSNHDSMGIVFKCLSKGAVDFLVKPIRKNELKNLWQHVWRRCHSSSGSGSESGIQTQKSVDSRSREGSDDNEQSNNEDDNGSTGLNVGDGSDHGSGTQNSWTKRAAEVDSPPALSPCDGQTDVHDSTCAQAIHPKQEKFWNNWVPDSGAEELNDQDDQPLENSAGGNNLQGADFTKPSIHPNYLPSGKVSTLQPDFGKDGAGEESMQEMKNLNEGLLEANIENTSSEPKAQDTDLIGSISYNSKLHNDIAGVNDSHGIQNLGDAHGDTLCNSKDVPFLELSLRRLRSGGDASIDAGGNRKILRHSSASAFSRYNSAAIQAPATCMDSSSTPLEPSSVAEHRTTAVFCNKKWNQGSDGSNSNNQDMGSSTKNMFPKSSPVKEKFSTPTAKYQHASETLVHGTRVQAPQEDKPSDAMTINETRRYAQVQNHHRHHSNSVQHLQSLNDPPQLHEHMECEEMVNITAAAQCCRYTNMFTGANDVQHGVNYSLNGSGSGSNHGSNTGGIMTGVANGESDTGGPGKSGNGGGSGSGSGVDQVRSAQREAALNKFRQKRKERCFEKRVRYQSRKRLAEQRPRVRGQFVRQPFQ